MALKSPAQEEWNDWKWIMIVVVIGFFVCIIGMSKVEKTHHIIGTVQNKYHIDSENAYMVLLNNTVYKLNKEQYDKIKANDFIDIAYKGRRIVSIETVKPDN